MMMRRRYPFLLRIIILVLLSLIEETRSIDWFGIFRSGDDDDDDGSDCLSPTTPTATSHPEPKPDPSPPPAAGPTEEQQSPPTNPAPTPASPPTTTSSTANNDRFTILVMSDLENQWRGHSVERSRYVVQYIKTVKDLNLFFDNEYSHYPIDPQLVINTGDVIHYWGCHLAAETGACRQPDEEFDDIWQQLYDAEIPMISSYGNHDWKPRIGTGNPYRGTPTRPRDLETDTINRYTSKFVHKTYQKTQEVAATMTIPTRPNTTAVVVGGNRNQKVQSKSQQPLLFEYEEIPPTGSIGQSMYRSSFRGLQIASFNAAYNWQSYNHKDSTSTSTSGTIYSADDQFNKLAETLDRSKPTLFFSHFPLSATRLRGQTPTKGQVVDLIQQFPSGSHHFAGHYHTAAIQPYSEGFNDYIVPYPHSWNGKQPGYLVVLVSPQEGILQVKPLTIPGLEDGTSCVLTSSAAAASRQQQDVPLSAQRLRQREKNLLGYPTTSTTRQEVVDNGCERCKSGKQYWSSEGSGGWFCGDEPNTNNPILAWDQEEDLPLDSLDYADFVEGFQD